MTREKRQSLLEAANNEMNSANYDEAERLLSEVLASTDAKISEEVEHHTIALLRLGNVARLRGNYTRALEQMIAALALSESTSDRAGMAMALGNIGIVHQRLSNYSKALECYGRSLEIFEELGNKEGMEKQLGNIGLVHYDISDYITAIEYHGKALELAEDLGSKQGMAAHLGNIGLVYRSLSNYTKALEFHTKALEIAEDLGSKATVARQLGNIGILHWDLSDFVLALEYFGKSLTQAEKLGDKALAANNLGNIGTVYLHLSDYSKSLEYYEKALIISEDIGNKRTVASSLGNIGNVYFNLSDYTKAFDYYAKALSIAEELGIKEFAATNLGSIGNIHFVLTDYTMALEYQVKALDYTEELGNKGAAAIHLNSIGKVYENQQNYELALEFYSRGLHLNEYLGIKSEAGKAKGSIGGLYARADWLGRDQSKAEKYLLESIAVSEELGTKVYEIHKILAELYKSQERWKECHEQFEIYHNLKEEVQNDEARKSTALMEQRRQIAEREKEIAIAKAAADAKHLATEQLLHNVMPQSIANEMLSGKQLIAQKLPNVSVMFADIVGFTTLSQSVSAEALVEGLDSVFSAIDALAEKHGLEKIKTIGDAYMVVSGAPVQREDHAEAMAQFALELAAASKDFSMNTSDNLLQLRIGIHCGEAVAGVIGKKKFAYDLWGDTVNTASRMESHGEPGKIHCSEAFKNVVGKDFQFRERGEMEIKGKGMMRTYFLEKA